jgi:uncharacterized damage-inducible protein DinB
MNAVQQLPFLTPDLLLAHWQGHRALTRRVIEAFPEDQLFTFSVGGMRPFGELARELLAMAVPMVAGLVNDDWSAYALSAADNRVELLRQWDESTARLEELWPQVRPERFQEELTAFGQYTDLGAKLLMYVIDNEIHHRGQGYVYLRALGIDPPAFWER